MVPYQDTLTAAVIAPPGALKGRFYYIAAGIGSGIAEAEQVWCT
jgi:hypothetical protein